MPSRTRSRPKPLATVPPKGASPQRQATLPSLLWQAPLLDTSGYAEEARAFVAGLHELQYAVGAVHAGRVSQRFIDQLSEAPPKWFPSLFSAFQTSISLPGVSIVHQPGNALHRHPGAGWNVGRTMFETDSLPPDWVTRANDMDEIWVPSSFNIDTFRRAGVNVPTYLIPSGVDAGTFTPGLRPLNIPGTKGTVFLSVFEWSYRKGWDVLLRSWWQAFTPSDDVTLVLRTFPRDQWDVDNAERHINSEIDAYLHDQLGVEREAVAPIVVLGRQISTADLPRLYASADAYVLPSRGEGWGRPYLEAMACGIPTVGTGWSGNCDFMNDENSLLVRVDRMVPVGVEMDVAFYRGHQWAEPSADHLTQILRDLAGDHQLRRRLGASARRSVEQRWQWRTVVNMVSERLQQISKEMGTRFAREMALSQPLTVVQWVGGVYGDESLAGVNREMCVRLAGHDGFQVLPSTRELPPYSAINEQRVRLALARQPTAAAGPVSVEVRNQWPPDLGPSTARALAVTQAWEYGSIPASWVDQFNANVTEVWCPTSWVRDVFVRDGVDGAKVHVVRQGTDTSFFTPTGPPLVLRTKKTMRLLFVGGTIGRKGIDVVLRAYLEEFNASEDVCLVIKAFGANGVYRDSNMDERIAALAADASLPDIELITEVFPTSLMAALYRSCHALVHPYRGEGLGLPIIEAMASGLPVVVTGAGACLDFCDDGNALLIPAQVVPTALEGLGPAVHRYTWFEPDVSSLRASMRSVLTDRLSADARAHRARARIVKDYQWDDIAEGVAQRLHALAGDENASPSA